MPSQISVFAKLVPLSPGDRIAIAVVSATAAHAPACHIGPCQEPTVSGGCKGRNYRGGSAGFCELLIAHSLVQVSLNITIPSSLISLLKQARPPGL
jgi:hypothetical protein